MYTYMSVSAFMHLREMRVAGNGVLWTSEKGKEGVSRGMKWHVCFCSAYIYVFESLTMKMDSKILI